jgi:hypothetical protein
MNPSELYEAYAAGAISRRAFISRLTAFGVGGAVAVGFASTIARGAAWGVADGAAGGSDLYDLYALYDLYNHPGN